MKLKTFLIIIMVVSGSLYAFSILTDDDGRYRAYQTCDLPFVYKVNVSVTGDWLTAIHDGAYTWNKVKGAYFEFSDGGTTSVGQLGWDGTNLVYFDNGEGGNFPEGTNTIAFSMTYTEHYSNPLYRAKESDLIWNARDFPPATDVSPTQQDLQSVVTHEFGHHLGLGHAGEPGSPPGVGEVIPDATMYGYSSDGDTTSRSLHIDDIMGAVSIYPRWIVNGTVMDSLDSLPVNNVTYYLNGTPLATISSVILNVTYQKAGYVKYDTLQADQNTGYFSFISPKDEITLTLDAYGYEAKDTTVYLGDSLAIRQETDISVYLSPMPKYHVTINVYDQVNSDDVKAKIQFKAETDYINEITFQDTTSEDGTLHIDLVRDSYRIVVNPDLPYALTVIENIEINKDTTINIGLPKAEILLVDDDFSPSMPERDDSEDFYFDQISQLSSIDKIAYKEAYLDSLSPVGFLEVPIIIWFTGNNDQPAMNNKIALIKDYMEDNGKILISGNKLFESITDTLFVETYLHASFGGNSPTQLLRGEVGDPIGDGKFLGISVISAEMIQKDDHQHSTDVFKYLGQSNSGCIKFESGYKLVLFAFGMENIIESSSYLSPEEVFSSTIEWLSELTAIGFAQAELPQKNEIHQNYPNPFNPTTTIEFDLNKKQRISIEIFNSLGQKIRSLKSSVMNAGSHQIIWNGKNDHRKDVSSGIYYYSLKAKDYSKVRKMLLIR